ncbi:MAG: TetR family transcriptional regulator C-terminal domain-containing protein, partial [Nitrososphaerales archaeon]
ENSVIRVREELSKVFVGRGAFEEQVSQVFTQLRKKMAGSEAANFEMLSESMRNPKMRKIMYNQRKRLRELVTEFLTGFANKKLIRKDLDIEALASGFLAMYDGLMVDVVLGFPDKLANGAWKATSSAIVKGSSPKVK